MRPVGGDAGSRSRRSDGDRTRERILVAALPLFAEQGFAGTGMRAVAAAAGVNVATLAYHFADKQGLYDAVVVRLHDDLERDFPAELGAVSGDPRALLGEVLSRAWVFVKAHRDAVRLQLRAVLDTGRQPEVVVARRAEPLLARAESLVGAFRPDWSRADRRLVVLSLMHVIVRLSLEDPGQLRAMLGGVDDLDAAVTGYLAGLARRELGLG